MRFIFAVFLRNLTYLPLSCAARHSSQEINRVEITDFVLLFTGSVAECTALKNVLPLRFPKWIRIFFPFLIYSVLSRRSTSGILICLSALGITSARSRKRIIEFGLLLVPRNNSFGSHAISWLVARSFTISRGVQLTSSPLSIVPLRRFVHFILP